MRPRHVLQAALIATLAVGLTAPAAGAPVQTLRFFKIKAVSTGSYVADYGRERLDPGQTTAAGVDGKESARWRWEVQTTARSVNGGPLHSGFEIARFKANLNHNIISYGIQMGQLGEDQLCERRRFNTKSDVHPPGRPNPRGDWIPRGAPVAVTHGGVSVDSSFDIPTCFHGYSGHGLKFVEGSGERQAPILRGAFNPVSDRAYSRTYTDTARVGRSHSGDPNAAHTFEGQSQLTVEIKRIPERRARRINRRYGNYPRGGLSDST
jgi:hypothetical protein